MKKYFKPYNIIRVLVCLIVLFLIVFPFLWLILSTFKMQKDIIKWPPTLWPKRWTIQNYIKVWDRIPLASYLCRGGIGLLCPGGLFGRLCLCTPPV